MLKVREALSKRSLEANPWRRARGDPLISRFHKFHLCRVEVLSSAVSLVRYSSDCGASKTDSFPVR